MTGGSTSPLQNAKDVYRTGGVTGFYAGLDAALMRQAVYSTLRLGIYFNLTEAVKTQMNKGKDLSLIQKIGCSLTAGGIGSFFATPCDLILVRM